ncbi:MAG TPA: NAD(P)H-dependent oxidoreductase subunit E [Clostridia bacterium]|jgi:NADP-reducing hydrogenase subunit HndA|nr:NAD(P)H-dependent oxidoreductase subunit E [Clostridia bacterium]
MASTNKHTKVPFKGTAEQAKQLDEALEIYKNMPGGLMPALQKAQEIYGYLPIEVQTKVADALNVSLEEVFGVATFYSQFTLNPSGEYKIGVCLGTACYVKGAGDLVDKVKEILKIEAGECTEDGKFSLVETRCIGCCGLAPVITVNADVYGKLTPSQVEDILKKY